jgi:flagellum-specific peptidoglycan hydrolase FlgJ
MYSIYTQNMLSPSQLQQLQVAAENAVSCETATKVPAELTVAQWVLESGWGSHQPGNNCFGIKAYDGCYGTQSLQTTEVVHGDTEHVAQVFATFPTLGACFEKHASLISQGRPYADAWARYMQMQDLQGLIHGIAPVYSTSPQYAQSLLQLIEMEAIRDAISTARRDFQPTPPASQTQVA